MAKFFLATPSIGTVDWQSHSNYKDFLCRSARWCEQEGHDIVTADIGRFSVHLAREDFAEMAIKLECDHIFWIDDDHILPWNCLERLYARMEECDIVMPLVFQRVPPFYPVCYGVKQEQVNGGMMVEQVKMDTYPENELFDIDACGLGVCLMKVSSFKDLKRPWFSSWTNIGEDIYLTMRAKDGGARVCCDSTFYCGHLSDRISIGEPQFQEFKKDKKITIYDISDSLLEVVEQDAAQEADKKESQENLEARVS